MAFLCNPNNPTGQLLAKSDVMRIATAARKLKCRLVVDEAFIDFCAGNSVIDMVRTNPFLIVLRSMTKFYALPGLRLGYGVFHRSLAGAVRSWKKPWTVNALALKAGVAALDDVAHRRATDKMIAAEKAFIEPALAKAGIEFVPTSANYYLLKFGNARKAVAELEQRRILVRDCSNFRGMGQSYVRIAVRTRKENRILMKELAAIHGAVKRR
ncbi:MAG TPA: aminotransferase class I/II-fold pyridoxal phosphate-dependent enzyme, partial [Nitrospirota bacterium]